MTTGIRKIVLAKSADWDTWISFVKTRASNSGIWELINPDKSILPPHLIEPVEPEFEPPTDPAQLNQLAYDLYRQQIQVYEFKLEKYEMQQRAFVELISFIQETLTIQNFIYIQQTESHFWHQLRALQARLALTNNAQSLTSEGVVHLHLRGCERHQTILIESGIFGYWDILRHWHLKILHLNFHLHLRECGRHQEFLGLKEHFNDDQVHGHSN